ncbi:sigma-70 family RNA polymerase sigma factor [Limnoglobus roseus]|uniref:Sigma-70 family RNA polymerase sigma factor n=1 Tax=Limnoglobus roseus TaxID=2598579 RepID=A0A5C1A2D2_9BACT|nr:sigma-70 family RNA polymerase sigma factor [Limnoglobus roseus]QEL13269.1 sigma-70 family RNA polymerase sigma factor [Limnoglobus roseus]
MTTALSTGIRRVAAQLAPDDTPDGELLTRFLANRDEVAFATIVRRHAAMVFGTCRRVIGNAADADDAFQAAFFVLARRAAAFTGRASVGNFLYGVAYHSALKAKAMATKRRLREANAQPPPMTADNSELLRVLDEELARLPEKYREPVVLCELEGKPRREVAVNLGIAEGTISSRLATAHRMLQKRLTARGFGVAGLAALLADRTATASPGLASAAVQAAFTGPTDGVTQLVAEVSKMLFLSKLKLGVAVIGVVVLMVAGVGGFRPGPANADEKLAPKAGEPALIKKLKAEKDEADKLRGTWASKKTSKYPATPADAGGSTYELRFDTDELVIVCTKPGERAEISKLRYVLNPSATPKELNIVGDRMLMLWLYELDGEKLKVAYYGRSEVARPKSFDPKDRPKDADPLTVIEFERKDAKPKADSPKQTTADEPAWKNDFYAAYALKDGEVLKRIPPPYPAARDEYLKQVAKQSEEAREKGLFWYRVDDGQLKMDGKGAVGIVDHRQTAQLRQVLDFGCLYSGVPRQEFECPEELLDRLIPGEFVFRAGAKVEDFAASLEGVLRDEMKWAVRVRVDTLEREVIVAKGLYRPKRLPDGKPDVIELDVIDPKGVAMGSIRSGTWDEFLNDISIYLRARVVGEAEVSPEQAVRWNYSYRAGGAKPDPK